MTHEGSAHHNLQKQREPYELAGTARELLPSELAHYGIAESGDPDRMCDYVAIRGETVPSQANPKILERKSGAVCLPIGAEADTTLRVFRGQDTEDVPQWLELSLDELIKAYPIDPGQEFTVGRSEKATHRLESMTVSSIHAHVTRHTDGRIIVSSSATNPLVVAIERPNPEESQTVELVDEEANTQEQRQIINGLHELSMNVDRLRSSLEDGLHTVRSVVRRVDGLQEEVDMLHRAARRGQFSPQQLADLTGGLRSLYQITQNPNMDRAVIVATNSAEGASSELAARELSDHQHALIKDVRTAIDESRSWRIGLERDLDINSSSNSGQFLGLIRSLEEALYSSHVSPQAIIKNLQAVSRDLDEFSSSLKRQVRGASPILEVVDRARRSLSGYQ